MEYVFGANIALTTVADGDRVKLTKTDFNLRVSDNLQEDKYINPDNGVPTKEGSYILSNILVQGLIGNLHFAKSKGFRDSKEHLEWIISELKRGFNSNLSVSETYTDNF